MAKFTKKSYPKAPKASASVETKQNYIKKCKEIDRENAKRLAEKKKSEALSKKIKAIRSK